MAMAHLMDVYKNCYAKEIFSRTVFVSFMKGTTSWILCSSFMANTNCNAQARARMYIHAPAMSCTPLATALVRPTFNDCFQGDWANRHLD